MVNYEPMPGTPIELAIKEAMAIAGNDVCQFTFNTIIVRVSKLSDPVNVRENFWRAMLRSRSGVASIVQDALQDALNFFGPWNNEISLSLQ